MAALGFILMGAFMLVAEVTMFLGVDNSLLSLVLQTDQFRAKETLSFISSNLLCLLPLGYMAVTANYGLFKLKLAGFYGMHKNKQTDPQHLLFSSLFLMRLSVPIIYNFLSIARVE